MRYFTFDREKTLNSPAPRQELGRNELFGIICHVQQV